jgi:phenylacetate-coenzyme A ligase PaaK-like adenylate-forming protein
MTETLHTRVLLRRLCSNVRRPPASLKRLQDRLLRAAVMHAYGNVPFYHRV